MLRSVALNRPEGDESRAFPFNIPALAGADAIPLDRRVVFLSGENGSGKSTFLEALAVNARLPSLGAAAAHDDPTLEAAGRLARHMRTAWSPRLTRGFFMRAEDVFGFILRVREQRAEAEREVAAMSREMAGASDFARGLALGPHRGTIADLDRRYGRDPDARSHGETFLHLFRERIVPDGIYLMDEPEAALSPRSQLALVSLMAEAVAGGSQFVIATHSPLLLSIPDALILSFDRSPLAPVQRDELESIRLWADILQAPERFMRHLWTAPKAP